MSVRTVPGNAGYHGVQFYLDETRLCLSVVDFLADGLVAGQPAVVIATKEHRDIIVNELTARHFDIEHLQTKGDILMLDAHRTLRRFFSNGSLDATRFRRVLGRAIDTVGAGRGPDCVVRAYGEMVDVLWNERKYQEAIQLEIMWNDLAKTHTFSLLCGYCVGNFYKEAGRQDVCDQHTHVHG